MRAVTIGFLLCSGLAVLTVLAGCAVDDDTATESSELNEGVGVLERELAPPIPVPTSEHIGAKMADVLADAKGTATATKAAPVEDCTTSRFKDARTKKVVVERIECKRSEVIRILAEDGTVSAEHADLDKDGIVDRFTGDSGAIVQLVDTDFDGKIDVVVERVAKLKDFSMEGYDEVYPKSRFLFRVREDRDHDGKLDHEKLTARGSLPKSE